MGSHKHFLFIQKKMYPARDFRSLIDKTDSPELKDEAIKSISREPLVEVFRYWKKTGSPNDKYDIYCRGIERAIANNRYDFTQINAVQYFPEFYQCILAGLEKLWTNLPMSLHHSPDGWSLHIGYITTTPIHLSNEEKLKIMSMLEHRMQIELIIDQIRCTVGIFVTRKAQEIYQKIFWLRKMKQT